MISNTTVWGRKSSLCYGFLGQKYKRNELVTQLVSNLQPLG